LTLTAACAASAAGDSIWISDDHAESTAGVVTITCPGTSANPSKIICVNHAGSVPPVAADMATTATVSTTGASNLTINGSFYCYGIQFQASATGGAVSAILFPGNTAGNTQYYKSCVFRSLGTLTPQINPAASNGIYTTFDNCSLKFGSTAGKMAPVGFFKWINSPNAIDGTGSLPTTLFQSGGTLVLVTCEGADFSALSAKTLVSGVQNSYTVLFKDCKLPASVTITGAPTGPSNTTTLIRCDSGATNYRNEKYTYYGTQTAETTIVRTGGASDGTTVQSNKIVTTANSSILLPFEVMPFSIWNESTSSVTLTVYGIWGGGAVPNNDDIWIDVEYLGSASTPQASFISSTKATILSPNAGCPSDASTWGGGTTAFKMAVTFTPGMKGPITVYPKCAKASTTFYIDPKPVLS
jgi:hypothetical protein